MLLQNNVPDNIPTQNCIPLTCGAVAILRSQAVSLDTNGLVVPSDNTASPVLDCIGIAATSASPGQQILVQTAGLAVFQNLDGSHAFSVGDFVGDSDGTGNLDDLGLGFGATDTVAAGILQAIDGSGVTALLTVLIVPGQIGAVGGGGASVTSVFGRVGDVVAEGSDYNGILDLTLGDGNSTIAFDSGSGGLFMSDGDGSNINIGPGNVVSMGGGAAGSTITIGFKNIVLTGQGAVNDAVVTVNGAPIPSGTIPTFIDAEVPATFNTNADYDLLHAPNPPASLQVFINSEAVPKPGNDRLLQQGVDYSLTTGAHGAGTRIHYLVTPTATNTIVCWYRM